MVELLHLVASTINISHSTQLTLVVAASIPVALSSEVSISPEMPREKDQRQASPSRGPHPHNQLLPPRAHNLQEQQPVVCLTCFTCPSRTFKEEGLG